MKFLVILIVVVLAVNARTTSDHEEWINFKSKHGKFFRSLLDESNRFSIFQNNLRTIEKHNALYDEGLETYRLGITSFADLTGEEFKELLTYRKSRRLNRQGRSLFQIPQDVEVPHSIDWRRKGAVTAVKDQGQCGACWAFSVTGSLEGHYFIKNKKLVSFSEQQLVDCATEEYGMEGCQGGQLDPAFKYIQDHGLQSEASYPFEMYDDQCRINNSLIVTKISGYKDVPENDEDALVAAVGTVGPVSVAIDATYLQFYRDGIYANQGCSQSDLNHGVVAVGYGSRNGHDYWIIKNSWGKHYGENGYVLMKRGVNICGITSEPTYPIL